MLMKNIFLILEILLSALITSAQYKESDLEGGTWVLTKESDIAAMLDITMSFKNGEMKNYSILHASATDTTTIYVQNTIQKYYLSDQQEDFFDESKCGKGGTGCYIIVQDLNDKKKATTDKIEKLTKSDMVLQYILPKTEKGVVRIGKDLSKDFFKRK